MTEAHAIIEPRFTRRPGECRTRPFGYLKAWIHRWTALRFGGGILHAVIKLKCKTRGDKDYGKTVLIGCTCSAVFWRLKSAVFDGAVEGDWARRHRNGMRVPARKQS